MKTWRQILKSLQDSTRLDGEALAYLPASQDGSEPAKVFEIILMDTVDGDLAEEYNFVQDDPLAVIKELR